MSEQTRSMGGSPRPLSDLKAAIERVEQGIREASEHDTHLAAVPVKLLRTILDAAKQINGRGPDAPVQGPAEDSNADTPRIETAGASPAQQAQPVARNDQVICPACCHQFTAISVLDQLHRSQIEREVDEARALLDQLRDFIGTDGIVNEAYSGKRDRLCKQISAYLNKTEGKP